jgi:hypothetical protein
VKKPIAAVGGVQQIPVFDPHPQTSEVKKLGPRVHPDTQLILPETLEIQVMVALEVVNLHAVSHDSSQVFHNGGESPDEDAVAAEPEVEDVTQQEQVGGPDASPDALQKTRQDLGIPAAQRCKVDVGQEISFHTYSFEGLIAWAEKL